METKKKKRTYILYKKYSLYNPINDTTSTDCINIMDFTTYKELKNYLKCIDRDLIRIINTNINSLENIPTYKNYFVIKE